MLKRLPRWLQIVLVIAALSIVGPLLAAFLVPAEPWLFAALYVALVRYPGPRPDRPRIVTWSLWLLALGFASSVLVEIAIWSGRDLLAESGGTVSQLDLWLSLVSSPILWLLLHKRSRFFFPALILATAGSVSLEIHDLYSQPRSVVNVFEAVGHLLSDGCLVWAFSRFPPHLLGKPNLSA